MTLASDIMSVTYVMCINIRLLTYSMPLITCMANGWQRFFYNRVQLFEKCWIKCISVAGDFAEISCA